MLHLCPCHCSWGVFEENLLAGGISTTQPSPQEPQTLEKPMSSYPPNVEPWNPLGSITLVALCRDVPVVGVICHPIDINPTVTCPTIHLLLLMPPFLPSSPLHHPSSLPDVLQQGGGTLNPWSIQWAHLKGDVPASCILELWGSGGTFRTTPEDAGSLINSSKSLKMGKMNKKGPSSGTFSLLVTLKLVVLTRQRDLFGSNQAWGLGTSYFSVHPR